MIEELNSLARARVLACFVVAEDVCEEAVITAAPLVSTALAPL